MKQNPFGVKHSNTRVVRLRDDFDKVVVETAERIRKYGGFKYETGILYHPWIAMFWWVMKDDFITTVYSENSISLNETKSRYTTLTLCGESSHKVKRIQRLCGSAILTTLPAWWFVECDPTDIVKGKLNGNV